MMIMMTMMMMMVVLVMMMMMAVTKCMLAVQRLFGRKLRRCFRDKVEDQKKGARPDDSDIFLKMEIAMPYPFHDASKQDLVE